MINKYFFSISNQYASKWVVLFIDSIIVAVAFVLSYFIRFNLSFNFSLEELLIQLPLVIFIFIVAFLLTSSHKGVVRHTGIKDVYAIFNSVCVASIGIIGFVLANKYLGIIDDFTIPLSIIIINSLVSFLALIALRVIFKITFENSFISKDKPQNNVLIYGAGESGILTHNTFLNHQKMGVKVVGFIDDSHQKIGKQINGVKVYSRNQITQRFIDFNTVREIIFSMQNLSPKRMTKMVDDMVNFGVKVKTVPPVEDWINGELKVSQIKNVQIEDLLDRPPIVIKNSKIAKNFREQTIVVTGGAGSIGSELVRQICKYQYHCLVVVDQAESALYDLQQELKQIGFYNFIPVVGDIRDKNKMRLLFETYKPSRIFHAAAYKHVPLMEQDPYEAIRINVMGTKTQLISQL